MHKNKVKQMKNPKKMKQVPWIKIKIKTKMRLLLNNKDICKRDYKIKVILKLYFRHVKHSSLSYSNNAQLYHHFYSLSWSKFQ